MATITPVRSSPAYNVVRVFWEGVSTADTATEIMPAGVEGVFASVQVVGTFGGATVQVEVSNNGVNWRPAEDPQGNNVEFTTPGMQDFSTAALYLRPASTGGTGDNVNVTLILRTQ